MAGKASYEGAMARARAWRDAEREGLNRQIDLAHAISVTARLDDVVGLASLARVVEEQGKAYRVACGELHRLLVRQAHTLAPPPDPHANCVIPCGPDCPELRCGRCGNPYGVGGHGPGFCIQRAS